MRLTPEKRRRYLAGGCSRCPFCGSADIEGTGRRDYDADWATNEITCLACEATWKDVYTIIDVQTEEEP